MFLVINESSRYTTYKMRVEQLTNRVKFLKPFLASQIKQIDPTFDGFDKLSKLNGVLPWSPLYYVLTLLII